LWNGDLRIGRKSAAFLRYAAFTFYIGLFFWKFNRLAQIFLDFDVEKLGKWRRLLNFFDDMGWIIFMFVNDFV
jgi:hypothetical protein